VFDLKESERSEEEYESMTDLEREIHEEGRELTAEERADLGDFNAVEDGVLDKFGTGPVDPTELAKALKAEGAALGIDVKITYTKEASGLGCFGANSATGEFGPISCSETAESLDDCGGSMASDYKSGTMKCKGFTVVGTKIK